MDDAAGAPIGKRRLRLKTDSGAMAINAITTTVHQHGSPAKIQSWGLREQRRPQVEVIQAAANGNVAVAVSREKLTNFLRPQVFDTFV